MRGFSLLVVKLSEALFRPMFIQLLDWATQTSAPRERLITFYHLADKYVGQWDPAINRASLNSHSFIFVCPMYYIHLQCSSINASLLWLLCVVLYSIAGKLKNLFLLFAGHIIKNITTLLTALHDDREGERTCLVHVAKEYLVYGSCSSIYNLKSVNS